MHTTLLTIIPPESWRGAQQPRPVYPCSLPITSSLPINLTSSLPISSSLPINLTTTAGLCPTNIGQSGRALPSNQFLSDSSHLPQSYMDQVCST